MIFQLMDETPRHIAIDRGRPRAAKGRRVGQRLGGDDALAELVGEGRPVDGAKRRLDEADLGPAAGAEGIVVADRGAAAGAGRRQHEIGRQRRQAAKGVEQVVRSKPQHAGMLSRAASRVTRSWRAFGRSRDRAG